MIEDFTVLKKRKKRFEKQKSKLLNGAETIQILRNQGGGWGRPKDYIIT